MNDRIWKQREAYNEQKLTEKLAERIRLPSGCLVHTGKADTYGSLYYKGKQCHLHRLSYERTYGKIEGKGNVLHKCDVKECSNPEHLYLGTQKDNSLDIHRGGNIERIRAEEEILEEEEQKLFKEFAGK